MIWPLTKRMYKERTMLESKHRICSRKAQLSPLRSRSSISCSYAHCYNLYKYSSVVGCEESLLNCSLRMNPEASKPINEKNLLAVVLVLSLIEVVFEVAIVSLWGTMYNLAFIIEVLQIILDRVSTMLSQITWLQSWRRRSMEMLNFYVLSDLATSGLFFAWFMFLVYHT
jgi:hypothetical protein